MTTKRRGARSPQPADAAAPATDPAAAPAPEQPLSRTLSFRLLLLHKLVERASAFEFVQSLGLSPSDGRALATLGSFEPMSVVELADACSLNKSQASRAAQALVDKGLVDKSVSKDDGRGVVLTLTPAGQVLFGRTTRFVAERSRSIFGCLSDAEQAQMGALLDRLIDHNRHRDPVRLPAGQDGGGRTMKDS